MTQVLTKILDAYKLAWACTSIQETQGAFTLWIGFEEKQRENHFQINY